MCQDFEHAFAISMHIPKFVFNLESVSMYKSGLLRIAVTTIIELHTQNIELNYIDVIKTMLRSKRNYFCLILFYLNLLISKMDLFFWKKNRL